MCIWVSTLDYAKSCQSFHCVYMGQHIKLRVVLPEPSLCVYTMCECRLRLRPKLQSELPRPIPRNSVESDHGCTSSIYFDNAGDNVTLTSQKPC